MLPTYFLRSYQGESFVNFAHIVRFWTDPGDRHVMASLLNDDTPVVMGRLEEGQSLQDWAEEMHERLALR